MQQRSFFTVFAEGVFFLKKKIASRIFDAVKAYYNKVMGLSDSPRKIAKGVALGLAFDFLPIPVISIPLSYLVARIIRCNPVAAVATVVFFKLAVPFFFTFNIMVGNALLGDVPGPGIIAGAGAGDKIFLGKLLEHGYPFLIGSLVNATLAGLAAYYALLFIIGRRRRRKDA